ncbi:MAG: hypothetical protein K9G05_02540 [Candidatus Nanopelagicales bacterium]|nr:hypothetical protein [Candidatus Nanopelagicales bacterium]MCF8539168.1 hypothetical protein [Candidatus Nanopelagicales bacterium]MCF8550942.1 hypothetical protein [Candidatus Nanopelagicales bacterium]
MENNRELMTTELDRITRRLTGINLTRLLPVVPVVYACAQAILDLTPGTYPPLPVVGAPAASAQLSVIVQDYLAQPSTDNDGAVAGLLTQLRRDLP